MKKLITDTDPTEEKVKLNGYRRTLKDLRNKEKYFCERNLECIECKLFGECVTAKVAGGIMK